MSVATSLFEGFDVEVPQNFGQEDLDAVAKAYGSKLKGIALRKQTSLRREILLAAESPAGDSACGWRFSPMGSQASVCREICGFRGLRPHRGTEVRLDAADQLGRSARRGAHGYGRP